jgi:VanZ family protein
MKSSLTNATRHPLAFFKDNPIVLNTSFKDLLVALYGAVAFFLCTLIAYRFGKAQDQPVSTFLLVAIMGSCATFFVSLILNLPRPDKFRILGLTSMFIFYASMAAFFIWYSHDDCYSSFAWDGLLVCLLFTAINLDRTFDPNRVKEIEKVLYNTIIAGLGLFVIWILVVSTVAKIYGQIYFYIGKPSF